MLHPIYFLPTLYTDTDMSIFGMVIVLAFQICILLMGFTALFSKGTQQYESWHEFPIDLLYKDVSSLDTKWRILASCPNSQYIGTLTPTTWSRPHHPQLYIHKLSKQQVITINHEDTYYFAADDTLFQVVIMNE